MSNLNQNIVPLKSKGAKLPLCKMVVYTFELQGDDIPLVICLHNTSYIQMKQGLWDLVFTTYKKHVYLIYYVLGHFS